MQKAIDVYHFADALDEIFAIFSRANKYIDETAPWVLARDPQKSDRLSTVLYNLVEALAIGSSLLIPFLPQKAGQALASLGQEARAYEDLTRWGLTQNGSKVVGGDKFFDRMDVKEVLAKFDALHAPKEEPQQPVAEVAPLKPQITIDEFAKTDLRVGKILACEKLAKSKKLLVSQIDVGEDKPRTIVSGLALHYTPEQMVGKTVIVVANLAPAKLCGVESQGMVLCATGADGKVVLLSPIDEVEAGGEVR